MDFQTFITQNRLKNIPSAIIERWQERVVKTGLHKHGESGARDYLANWGKSIGAPKVIALACQAENEGAVEMAVGFWKAAYKLVTGETVTTDIVLDGPQGKPVLIVSEPVPVPSHFPAYLQPGQLVTMQPTDTDCHVSYFTENSDYIAQPKVDGNRMVIFGDQSGVYYQSRSRKLKAAPDDALHQVLAEQARKFPFILDGEAVYFDWRGGEHRTAAQAVTTNILEDHPESRVKFEYCVFEALYDNGLDLTLLPKVTRIQHGLFILERIVAPQIYMLPTAYSRHDKKYLWEAQRADGREGVVFCLKSAVYHAGKRENTDIVVRKKNLVEFVAQVIALTPSDKSRAFAAIEIARDGIAIGKVGTGYTLEEMGQIARRFTAGPLNIKVVSQGFTETGQVWHGRFDGFATSPT